MNKADGEGAVRARIALGDLRAALRYLPRKRPGWTPRVLAISGQTGDGLDELWGVIEEHRTSLEASGELKTLRAEQQRAWMWAIILDRLERTFRTDPKVAARLTAIEGDVVAGRTTPSAAADALLGEWGVARARDA